MNLFLENNKILFQKELKNVENVWSIPKIISVSKQKSLEMYT